MNIVGHHKSHHSSLVTLRTYLTKLQTTLRVAHTPLPLASTLAPAIPAIVVPRPAARCQTLRTHEANTVQDRYFWRFRIASFSLYFPLSVLSKRINWRPILPKLFVGSILTSDQFCVFQCSTSGGRRCAIRTPPPQVKLPRANIFYPKPRPAPGWCRFSCCQVLVHRGTDQSPHDEPEPCGMKEGSAGRNRAGATETLKQVPRIFWMLGWGVESSDRRCAVRVENSSQE